MTRHILFVDDETRILDSIRRSLHNADPNWKTSFASSVDEALTFLGGNVVDVVVTDVTMPGRDGFDLIRAMAVLPATSNIPVLVVTGLADDNLKRQALDAGAFDLIGKPVRREDLIARLRSVLKTKEYQDSLASLNATLERQVAERTRELESSRNDILVCLAMAGECRDTETGRHLIRVARYAKLLAETLGLPADDVEVVFKAAPLHDIGKLGIPDRILLKPGPYEPAERVIMQEHCGIGHRILTTPTAVAALFDANEARRPSNPLLSAAAEIAMCHHERWDGTGYPRRLAGESIPLAARIVSVADVYDALTVRRPYKEAMPHEAAAKLVCDGSGTQFDPRMVEAFQKVAGEFEAIRNAWADSLADQGRSLTAIGKMFEAMRKSA